MGCVYYCQNSLRLDAVPNPAGIDIGSDRRSWLHIDLVDPLDPTFPTVRPDPNPTTEAILQDFGF